MCIKVAVLSSKWERKSSFLISKIVSTGFECVKGCLLEQPFFIVQVAFPFPVVLICTCSSPLAVGSARCNFAG